MASIRISIPRDYVRFLNSLTDSEGSGKPVFSAMADALAFCAALGYCRSVFIPVEQTGGDPIRQEIFERRQHDTLIGLLAVARKGDVSILSDEEDSEKERVSVFEGYAHGGLLELEKELKGFELASERIRKVVNLVMPFRAGLDATRDESDELSDLLR